MKVGFIGLGTMGAPMAANILKGGYNVIAYDLVDAAISELVLVGARRASDPADCAKDADVLITMLPNPENVVAAAHGHSGILGFLSTLREKSTYIDMSTNSPDAVRELGNHVSRQGARMLDCPVGRTVDHAVAGTLALMVGGDEHVIDDVQPILMCMGEVILRCGTLGTGMASKLTNNFLATAILAASCEALVLGAKAGLSLKHMTSVFSETMANNKQINIAMRNKVFQGDYEPGFRIRLGEKDLRLALEMARALQVDTPVGHATFDDLRQSIQHGFGDEDISCLIRHMEHDANVMLRMRGEIP